jgi:hypothetical protein
MHKNLVIIFNGNTLLSSIGAAAGFLKTHQLILPINVAVYPPNEQSFASVFDDVIDFAAYLSHPSSRFAEVMMAIFRECYIILVVLPFL